MARLSVKQAPPKWVSMVTAAIILLVSSKSILIDAIPSISDEIKVVAGLWFDYFGKVSGVIFGLMSIFMGTGNKGK